MNPAQENLNRYIQEVFPMQPQISERIARTFHLKEFPKAELLLKEGKISDEYCYMDQGFMRAFTFDSEGNEVTTSFFRKDN